MKDLKEITVNVYNCNYDNSNYITSFKIKNYKRLIDIKKRLIDFIRLQKDMEHKKMRFYCFKLDNNIGQFRETDLNYINY